MSGDTVLVTGANSLLGQHLIKHLQLHWEKLAKVITFDLKSPFENRLSYESKAEVETFVGSILDSDLIERLFMDDGVSTVIHLLDLQDVSMFPDSDAMWELNVRGTQIFVSASEKHGVSRFIHGSSMFLMMSKYFPSVYNPESAPIPAPSAQLFPEYSRTKVEAEKIVKESSLQSFVIRLCLMYGEEDRESAMFHAVRTAKAHGDTGLPLLGDNRGVIQYAYAGNVAWGLIHVLRLMYSDTSLTNEVVFLPDATPLKGFYDLLEPFIKAGGHKFSEKPYPWLITYSVYCFAEGLLKLANKIFDVRKSFSCFPSSAFLMAHYHFWYFFSGFKARVFLDYQPLYTYEESVKNCAKYYAGL